MALSESRAASKPLFSHANGAAQIFAVQASYAAEKVDYFVILSEAKNLSSF